MKEFAGKVAVVTGAASGVGLGLAEAFAAAGMKVVISDVREDALAEAERQVAALGEVRSVEADVSRSEDVENLAERSIEEFGAVHLLCNNAGVASSQSLLWESSLEEWNWHLGVMVMGVVHGIRSFVPRMLSQGDECHVLNTASMGGLIAGSDSQVVYMTAKHGVVALTEGLQHQLEAQTDKIRCSVLCPAWVSSNVFDNFEALRPQGVPSPSDTPEGKEGIAIAQQMLKAGKPAREVGEIVMQHIRDGKFYILTHPDWVNMVEGRLRGIIDGLDPQRPAPPIG